MGFFKELEDSFLEGMRRPPSVPLFGVTVKKAASPIDPARLSAQYTTVRTRLSLIHRKLVSMWADQLGGHIDPEVSFSYVFAYLTAATCFWSNDIYDPAERYLYAPLVRAFEEIVSTDAKFLPLSATDIHNIPVDDHFALSETLKELETFLENPENVIDVCADHLFYFGVAILDGLPEQISQARKDVDRSLSTRLIEAMTEPHHHLATTLRHFVGIDAADFREHDLLVAFRENMFENVLAASGLTIEDLEKKDFDTPLSHLDTPASALTVRFLGNSPLTDFFLTSVPYAF